MWILISSTPSCSVAFFICASHGAYAVYVTCCIGFSLGELAITSWPMGWQFLISTGQTSLHRNWANGPGVKVQGRIPFLNLLV